MSNVHEVELEITSEASMKRLAAALAGAFQPGDTVTLDGPLGAGKSVLSRAIIYALGLPEEEAVPSPTFALVNAYDIDASERESGTDDTTDDTWLTILHADVYRLGDISELGALGFEDEPGAIKLVEWGGQYAKALEPVALRITIERLEASRRRVHLCGRADLIRVATRTPL